MSRHPQAEVTTRSQKWLQILVNERPDVLQRALPPALGPVEWLSPLKADDYAEYRDASFVELLGIELRQRPLRDFWPKGGPQWDALGRTAEGDFILIEAKAHIAEMASPPCGAKDKASKERIAASLAEVKRRLAPGNRADWSRTYYQYTNRLAHLYLLRTLNGLPAWLVFLHFVNARDVPLPASREHWEGAISLLHATLGLGKHLLRPYVLDVFVDVGELVG